jgi:enoyl-CoA hydratase/carnithine racemase
MEHGFRMSADKNVLWHNRNGVAWIVLNRPKAAHALDEDMKNELFSAIDAAEQDHTVKAVVLSGSGNRTFCAGIDLKNPGGLGVDELAEQRRQRVLQCLLRIIDVEKPLIGAINGAAVGAGCMIALLADVVVAADNATFSFPEIDLGVPTFFGFEVLRQLAGDRLAADLVLGGGVISAHEASSRGLIQQVTTVEGLAVVAQDLARARAAKPATAYGLIKRWWNETRRAGVLGAGEESRRARSILHSAGEGFGHPRAVR